MLYEEGPVCEGKPFKYIIRGGPSTLLRSSVPKKDNDRKQDPTVEHFNNLK